MSVPLRAKPSTMPTCVRARGAEPGGGAHAGPDLPARGKVSREQRGERYAGETAGRPEVPEVGSQVAPPLPPLAEVGLCRRECHPVAREANALAAHHHR